MPVLSKGLSDALSQCGVEHRLVSELMDRVLFLAALKEYDVVVCCPNVTEGFYLPALEVMAAGAILIVPDCVGNRGFCIDGTTCLMPAYTADKMRESVLKALSLTESQRNALLYAALKKVGEYSLEKERKAFYAVLKNVDQLW